MGHSVCSLEIEDGSPNELEFRERISRELNAEEKESFVKVMREFSNCFARNQLGRCKVVEHEISLMENARSIYQPLRASAW